ncbi:hypothetical protein HJD18_05050 [Thermoleophilia bacterium SCSIO 60948]|nr:hypothetical protein HJD18_05050 [Thermoleophilia bacterium SCSIO 60948]
MKRRGDLVAGILLGIVIGIAIIAVFVFVFSPETIDAPSLDGPVGRQGTGPSVEAGPR